MANHLSEASDPAAKSSGKPAPAIVYEVVTQHAEDASFLWLLRHAAVSQPHYSLADLSKLDLSRLLCLSHGLSALLLLRFIGLIPV
jgi:hypothetical protein